MISRTQTTWSWTLTVAGSVDFSQWPQSPLKLTIMRVLSKIETIIYCLSMLTCNTYNFLKTIFWKLREFKWSLNSKQINTSKKNPLKVLGSQILLSKTKECFIFLILKWNPGETKQGYLSNFMFRENIRVIVLHTPKISIVVDNICFHYAISSINTNRSV